jgi:hypothetical protein
VYEGTVIGFPIVLKTVQLALAIVHRAVVVDILARGMTRNSKSKTKTDQITPVGLTVIATVMPKYWWLGKEEFPLDNLIYRVLGNLRLAHY